MWYVLPDSNKQYPLTIERVQKIRSLNHQNIIPEELEAVDVTTMKQKEVEPEFVDVVGHITLKSLEKADKKRHQQQRPQQQRPQQQRPQQGQQPRGIQKSGDQQGGQDTGQGQQRQRPQQRQNPQGQQQSHGQKIKAVKGNSQTASSQIVQTPIGNSHRVGHGHRVKGRQKRIRDWFSHRGPQRISFCGPLCSLYDSLWSFS